MSILKKIEAEQVKNERIGSFRPGDTVRVHVRIKEGDKERVQVFEGVVLNMKRGGSRASFTVRKISYGIGVERVFPLHSPFLEAVEVVSSGKVRRARLYYLRDRRGKAARLRERDRSGRREPGTAAEAAAMADGEAEVAESAAATEDESEG